MPRDHLFRDQHRLIDITLGARQIAYYIRSKTESDFHADNMLHDAVIMQLIVVGESVNKLSQEFRARFPETDWDEIISLRHRLAHDYFGTDLRIAWEIATVHVVRLLRHVTTILAIEYPDELD